MIDKQKEFSGFTPVRPEHTIDTEALQRYLQEHIKDFPGTFSIQQFKGGQSNPTYFLDAGTRQYVLRRKPSGELLKSAHAVDREYRVISALADTGVPVARAHHLCRDESIIGAWLYLMDYVEGRIFWSIDAMPHPERPALYDAMVDVIAKLHSVDYRAVGLEDYGKPGNYFARQVSRWSKQYEASKDADYPAMDRLIAWLREHIPENDETTIVHGDYRLDNLVFHPTEPRILAILDWELSTLGHPLSDFSYQCMGWHLPQEAFGGLAGLDLTAMNIPTEADYIQRYCEKTGRKDIEHWNYYLAFNIFRLASIIHGIIGRITAGTAASAQARDIAKLARPLGELGWRLAQTA
jgi:aminoglycoside phosphotransferase (APT) family kinase protein